MLASLFGVSFLTPLDGLFVLMAALPLGALFLTERRAARIRRLLAVSGPRRRAVAPVVTALVVLSALIALAATQPVFVREQLVSERIDAQAFVLIDTSLSMRASAGPDAPSRLQRAKRMAIRLAARAERHPIRGRIDDRPLASPPHADDRSGAL